MRQDDVTLIRRARDGSRTAIGEVFEKVGGKLHAMVQCRINGPIAQRVDAGDIVQAAMLKAFDNIDQFDGEGQQTLLGWMARIAQNELRDQAVFHGRDRRDVRQGEAIATQHGNIAAQVQTQSTLLAQKEETQRLYDALDQLDELPREVVLLRKFEELSFREIGDRVGKSPDACRMMLARAMSRLTRLLREAQS